MIQEETFLVSNPEIKGRTYTPSFRWCVLSSKKALSWINPVLKISFLLCEKSLRNFKNSLHSFEKNQRKKENPKKEKNCIGNKMRFR